MSLRFPLPEGVYDYEMASLSGDRAGRDTSGEYSVPLPTISNSNDGHHEYSEVAIDCRNGSMEHSSAPLSTIRDSATRSTEEYSGITSGPEDEQNEYDVPFD